MKRIIFVCLLPLVFACEVRNDVAQNPENLSAETRIDENRADWCQSFCEFRVTCPNTNCDCGESVCYCLEQIDMATCVQGCADYFDLYVDHGEACAQEGLDQMDCVDALSCEQIAHGDCLPSADEVPLPVCGGGEEPGPGPDPGPGGLVTCGMSGMQGVAPGAMSFECGTEAHDCSDLHDYGSSCVETADHRGLCTCSVDYEMTGSFYLPELVCPSEADVNVGCGFLLAPSLPIGPAPENCNGASGGGTSANGWGCSSEHSCANGLFEVVCSEDRGYPACVCLADGVEVGAFIVPDSVCPSGATPDEVARINAGCGWGLDVL